MTFQPLTAEMRTNFRNLYADVFWYGVLSGSAMAFLSIYAARLGASTFQISLLTAGPAVANLLISMPAGQWMQNKPLVGVAFWSSIGQRSGYAIFALLPFLFAARGQVWMLALISMIMAVPGTVLAISFNAVLADVIPPEWRGRVVGRRNAILALSTIATSLVCGQLLDQILPYYNYQIIFALGAAGGLLSSLYVSRLRIPSQEPVRVWSLINDYARPGLQRFSDSLRTSAGLRFLTRKRDTSLLRTDLLRSPFGAFMLACCVFYTFQFTSIPIYPLFIVNVLTLGDGQIGIGNSLFYLAMMVTSISLNAISSRLSHRGVLILGALLFGMYPLIIALAHDATLFYVASTVGGVAWALWSGGLLNRLFERSPENDRPAAMALHNLVMNLGILVGSLFGPTLAASVGNLREVLLISAGLRFMAGFFFLFLG
jgi:MFS family permease